MQMEYIKGAECRRGPWPSHFSLCEHQNKTPDSAFSCDTTLNLTYKTLKSPLFEFTSMAENQLTEYPRGNELAPDIQNTAPRLIGFLSTLLERLAESNERRREQASPAMQNPTAFHGVTLPSISIRSYLERIFRYANCSESCYLVAYVYLDRLAQRQPMVGAVDSLNIHRLLITSVLIAAKFMDDMYYNNAYYARIGGISTKEMNFLEVEFLFGLGFRLNISPSTFHGYNDYLHREMLLIQPTLIMNRSPNNMVIDNQHCSSSSVRLIHHQSCFTASNSVVDHQDDATNPSSHHHHQQLAV
ncbi:uncharacterized protein [Phyllobates terribilis]|uniref:uncharacterized protein n=1 Tax=Phyllobates terribilis TaxID=111132 RepID=UPI003CCB18B1